MENAKMHEIINLETHVLKKFVFFELESFLE